MIDLKEYLSKNNKIKILNCQKCSAEEIADVINMQWMANEDIFSAIAKQQVRHFKAK